MKLRGIVARPRIVPLRQPDETLVAWTKRAERVRLTLRVIAASIFLGVMTMELMSGLHGNPFYLFIMAFTLIFVFLASDRVTSAIELAEHEATWAAVDARQAARRKDSGDTHAG